MIVTNHGYIIVIYATKVFRAVHVSRHADSCHKNNIKENIRNANDNEQKEEKRDRRFRQQWLDIDNFQPWLREVPDNNTILDNTILDNISILYYLWQNNC